MASDSIAHEAEGRMGHRLTAHSGSRINCLDSVNISGLSSFHFILQALCHPRKKGRVVATSSSDSSDWDVKVFNTRGVEIRWKRRKRFMELALYFSIVK